MDFGSIIGFIAIAVISSLLNKDKKVKPQQPNKNNKRQIQASSTSTNTRKTFKSGLDDLFNELKSEYDKSIKYNDSKDLSDHSKLNTVKADHNEKNETDQDHLYDNTKINKGVIYDQEIGKNETSIEFNRKSIVQGVIMSEILQKPKALRR